MLNLLASMSRFRRSLFALRFVEFVGTFWTEPRVASEGQVVAGGRFAAVGTEPRRSVMVVGRCSVHAELLGYVTGETTPLASNEAIVEAFSIGDRF
jgi:hypothetical protein